MSFEKEWCFYLCKNTNLKAIHNEKKTNSFILVGVSTYAKILI